MCDCLFVCLFVDVKGKDLKQFKDNLKEEEKLEVKRVEASSTKAERKIAVNQVKLDLQTRRPEKVRV